MKNEIFRVSICQDFSLYCYEDGHVDWNSDKFYIKNRSSEYFVLYIYIYIYIHMTILSVTDLLN